MSEYKPVADIKILGVGGGGGNAVNRLVENKIKNVDIYAVNTDMQALNTSKVSKKISIGKLGAGANPEVGKKAALDNEVKIKETIKGADMVFVVAGMGGGTGTGAAPVIAKNAKAQGSLTVGVVTRPFTFEGQRRSKQAKDGIEELRKHVDALILISNDQLLKVAGNIALSDAFKFSDKVLQNSVQTITDLITVPALINLDFADVRATLTDAGDALIGIGAAQGENKAIEATKKALDSPLLEAKIKGAKRAIVNVTGGMSMSLEDANKAVELVKKESGGNLDVIFGVAVNEELKDAMVVTVIATGFNIVSAQAEENVEDKENDIPLFNIGFRKPPVKEPAPAPRTMVGAATIDVKEKNDDLAATKVFQTRSEKYANQPNRLNNPTPQKTMQVPTANIGSSEGISVKKKKKQFNLFDTITKFILEEDEV